jgi:hypothetical protein
LPKFLVHDKPRKVNVLITGSNVTNSENLDFFLQPWDTISVNTQKSFTILSTGYDVLDKRPDRSQNPLAHV